MIDLDPAHLAAAIALCEPLNIRTIAFDVPTLDLLKQFQRELECMIRSDSERHRQAPTLPLEPAGTLRSLCDPQHQQSAVVLLAVPVMIRPEPTQFSPVP